MKKITELKNKKFIKNRVILRLDYNVPIIDNKIVDDTRIRETIKTITFLLDLPVKIIILSHRGRINKKEDLANNSLEIVGNYLKKIFTNRKVIFIPYTSGKKLKEKIEENDYDIALIENTRFEDLDNKKESKGNLELSQEWSLLGDCLVFDAFGVSHRKHASTSNLCGCCETYLGFLVEKEIKYLDSIFDNINDTDVIIGGSKISDKIKILNNLIDKVRNIYIGGAMAFTFLKALGYNVGKSLYEDDKVDYAKKIIEKYNDKIFIPKEFIVVDDIKNPTYIKTKKINEFINKDIGVDISKKNIDIFIKNIETAKIIVWNGPLGIYEIEEYARGSKYLCKKISELKGQTIIGGGDSGVICEQLNIKDKINHVSTGGGAFLSFLQGENILNKTKLTKQ